MGEKKEKMEEETELDLTNNKSSKTAVWTFFIIVIIILLLYWGWDSLPFNIQNDISGQTHSQTQTDPVATYDSYRDRLDQILSNAPENPDKAQKEKIIEQVQQLKKEVENNKEALKLPDGSYKNYDNMQEKITKVLDKYKAM